MREGFPLQTLNSVQTLTPKPQNSFAQNCTPNLVIVQRGTRQGGFPPHKTNPYQLEEQETVSHVLRRAQNVSESSYVIPESY